MYGLARPLLFRMDPERAHELGLRYLERVHRSARRQRRWARRIGPPDARLRTHAFGLAFPRPVGMAAGFDKGAVCYDALLALGFGHVEVGTVTPLAQPGNPKPRIERHPGHEALVNRLGFNNPGADAVRARLAGHAPRGIVGANVGKNKDTPDERAVQDYATAAAALAPHAAYVTVNVSSPNTPGLRALQEPKTVARLVARVIETLDDAGARRPVLLKLHPDAAADALIATARAAADAGAAGLVAVNTTAARPPGLDGAGPGGLSGRPLAGRATELTRALHAAMPDVPIVGVGGIFTGADVVERVRAGASVLQAYTGFIYRGLRFPALVEREALAALDEAGVDRLEEVVGTA